jgi:RNA polymerase sigma-70 factor (ECF subfamily)
VQRNEEFAILREALEDLSPDHRRAITLVFFEGLTLRRAGELMGGRTEDAVRMMLRRAEARLREITAARLES